MYTFQNRGYVILIIKNQPNATTCLNNFLSRLVFIYLENVNLFEKGQHLGWCFNSLFKRS
jgi:hypothetical protein